MTSVAVAQTGITFANTGASNDAVIAINASSELTIDRPIQASGGIVASSMTIGGSGSYSASTNFDELTAGDLKFKDDSDVVITVTAPASVTAHTLTLPSAQGAARSVLENDGSGGLSWAPKAWSSFASDVTSGFTATNTKVDLDITNFKDGTKEELLVEVFTNLHATTFILHKSMLSVMDFANNGGYRYERGLYDTRYIMYKIHDTQTNLELEVGNLTLVKVRTYTR